MSTLVRSHRLPLALFTLLVLAVTVLATLSVPAATQADDRTRTGHEYYYYSDNTFTTLVGFEVWCSNGSHSGWGCHTSFVEIEDSAC
jgi:hypothetical protein